jgi:starvation-inducible outer membrane lipoprotein
MATSFAYLRTTLQALACGCVLALTACASTPPPTGELAAARQAVSRASDADAEQYASSELARAGELLAQAQAAMAGGREGEARDLALRSAALADLATARSREASVGAELEQRRAEVADLRQRLRLEDAP